MAFFGLLGGDQPQDSQAPMGLLGDPNAMLQLAAGLFATRKGDFGGGFGAALAKAGAQLNQDQVQERANRQNDLQQLQGAYQLMRQQELPKMFALGPAYKPPPEMVQMETRLAKLLGLPNASGSQAGASAAGPKMQDQVPVASPVPSAPVTPLQSTPQNPQFNVPPQAQAAPQAPQAFPTLPGQAGGTPMPYWMMADPTGKAFLEQVAKDNAPQSTRYGIFLRDQNNPQRFNPAGGALPQGAMPYQFDAQGNPYVGPYKGQLETAAAGAAAVSGGKAAGEFPYRVENVETAGGARLPQLLTNIVGTPNPGGQPKPPGVPSFLQPQVASLQVTQPSQNVPDKFADIPRRYEPQGLGQKTFDKAMAEHQATAAAETAKEVGTAAEAANQRIALNNQAKELVDKADTGPMAAQIGDVKNWLVSRLGIPEGDFENTPSATASLQKDLLNAATNKAKQQFGSRMTQSEVMLMLSRGAPNIDMPKAAIKYLIDSDSAMSNYAIQRAQDYGTYLQKGGDPMLFNQWYARKNPAAATLGEVKLQTAPAPQSGGGWAIKKLD